MENDQQVREVPEMSPDPRVRVFRRTTHELNDFDNFEVDAYVIIGDQYAIFLDTLLCPADMAQVWSTVALEPGSKQILCVNSHADWDHTWGNHYFSDAHHIPILAHDYCLQRMRSPQARAELADFQARSAIFREVQLQLPSLTFNERLAIYDGALTIELLHAPGHCLDQIVAWLPEIRLLLAFDTVESPFPYIENAACAPLMFSTLERLASLHAQQVLCSHGKTTDPELIHKNLAYLREIERRCRALLTSHFPTEEELVQSAQLIGYPFDEAIAGTSADIDRTFYSQAHENNIRAILRWLLP